MTELTDRVRLSGWNTAIGRRFKDGFTVAQMAGYSAEAYFAVRAAEAKILAAVAKIDPKVDTASLARDIGALLADDVREAVAAAVAEAPERDAEAIADATLTALVERLAVTS